MKKQLAKGFTMLMLVVALAFATAVVSASGQSRLAKASVPFDFIVGGETMEAGDYNVDSVTTGTDILRIMSATGKASAARLTIPLNGDTEHAKLVFHRYGQSYFLAEVWMDGGSQGRELTKSRQERAIQKELSRVASLSGEKAGHSYETVEIATTLN